MALPHQEASRDPARLSRIAKAVNDAPLLDPFIPQGKFHFSAVAEAIEARTPDFPNGFSERIEGRRLARIIGALQGHEFPDGTTICRALPDGATKRPYVWARVQKSGVENFIREILEFEESVQIAKAEAEQRWKAEKEFKEQMKRELSERNTLNLARKQHRFEGEFTPSTSTAASLSRRSTAHRCGTCTFYDAPSYQCRVGRPSIGPAGKAAWPIVTVDDWCADGDWTDTELPALRVVGGDDF